MRPRQTFLTIDDEVLLRFNARFLGGPGDVEAADAEVGILDVEVVGETYGAIRVHRDGHVGWFCLLAGLKGVSRETARPTFHPLVDRVRRGTGQRCIQVLPQNIDLVG